MVSLPGTGKPSRPDTKKAAKPAARRHFSTIQPPRVNFQLPPGLKTSPRCKANVKQCKLFSHFVLSRFPAPDARNYATFSTLHIESWYQAISHFVLRPIFKLFCRLCLQADKGSGQSQFAPLKLRSLALVPSSGAQSAPSNSTYGSSTARLFFPRQSAPVTDSRLFRAPASPAGI